MILQEGPRSSNTESDDGLSEEEELASANRAAGRSAEAGGLAVSRSAEAGGLAVSRSAEAGGLAVSRSEDLEEGEEEEDNMTSRERSEQQENDSRGRETVEAGDSALEEDMSEEEVGWTKSYHLCQPIG